MPTPVTSARQCLTDEAARALDDAVAVARRRGHSQTSSLHAISALLANPSSALREACARARSSAYSPRLQFRALELSVGVSLDRLPSSKPVDDPPVSNSLMAAIKRSQANQRRHPDSFHFHHQILSQNAAAQTTPVVRVEIKHFVLSILDDPIVSRVFGEAGFRSCDIKLAILHPPLPYSRTAVRCPPLFLCNLTDSDLSPARRAVGFGFSFPFSDGYENSRRIAEVLALKSGRNPLLLGVCAGEALEGFTRALQSGKAGLLPPEISGLAAIVIEGEVSEFVGGGCGGREAEERLSLMIDRAVEECSGGTGVVLSIGDLKSFVEDGVSVDRVGSVVSRLKSLLELHSGKLWLIGSAASYDVYLKFSALFPSIEKDWGLHILTITSSSKTSPDGPYSKSSLMGSFVPFGGFFAAPSELKSPCSNTNQYFTRCVSCTEKYDHDVASMLKEGSTVSVSSPFSESLPCFRMAELDAGKVMDSMKTNDGRTTLTAKISELQKKWNEFCQRHHHNQPILKTDVLHAGSKVPSLDGLKSIVHVQKSSDEDSGTYEKQSELPSSSTVTNLPKTASSKQCSLMTTASDTEKIAEGSENFPIEIMSPSLRPRPFRDLNLHLACSLAPDIPCVTTDLGLGTIYAVPSTDKEPRALRLQDPPRVRPQPVRSSYSTKNDATRSCDSRRMIQSSPCSVSSFRGQFDPRDLKSFRRALIEKVGRQYEAISAISQALCIVKSGGGKQRGSNFRGDIWLTFLGPDKVGKKRIASVLTELLYGSRESLISVDLGCQDRGWRSNSIFEADDDYDLKFRGKTVVDYLAEELGKKHHSIVFLENIDKADMLAQNSLSQAIKTGKFWDLRGREISINNTVFVTTASTIKGKPSHHPDKDPIKFPEEIILAAKRFQMKIVIDSFPGDTSHGYSSKVRATPSEASPITSSLKKRKLVDVSHSTEQVLESQKCNHKASRSFLDLNVPVEEIEEGDEYDSDSISESSEAWLEDFLEQVDEKVAFKPFDFDALSEEILDGINTNLKGVLGPEAVLEIDHKAMIQILGAAWLSEDRRSIEDWIERVLCRGLAEAEKKYKGTSRCVMRLVASEALIAKEQTSCVCLPGRISIS